MGELRKMFTTGSCPGFINQDRIYSVAKEVLDIAKTGLVERDLGEEVFLDSLYERVENKTNPAIDYVRMRKEGRSISDIIREYA